MTALGFGAITTTRLEVRRTSKKRYTRDEDTREGRAIKRTCMELEQAGPARTRASANTWSTSAKWQQALANAILPHVPTRVHRSMAVVRQAECVEPTSVLEVKGSMSQDVMHNVLHGFGNTRFAIGCCRCVMVMDLSTRRCLTRLWMEHFADGKDAPRMDAAAVRWCPDGTRLAVVGTTPGSRVHMVDVQHTATGSKAPGTGLELKLHVGHEDQTINAIHWRDSHVLATSDSKGWITVMDTRGNGHDTWFLASPSQAHDTVYAMAWSNNQRYLATGTLDNRVHVWDVRNTRVPCWSVSDAPGQHLSGVKGLAWHPVWDHWLVTGAGVHDGRVRVLRTDGAGAPAEPWPLGRRSPGPLRTDYQLTGLWWRQDGRQLVTTHGFYRHGLTKEPPLGRMAWAVWPFGDGAPTTSAQALDRAKQHGPCSYGLGQARVLSSWQTDDETTLVTAMDRGTEHRLPSCVMTWAGLQWGLQRGLRRPNGRPPSSRPGGETDVDVGFGVDAMVLR